MLPEEAIYNINTILILVTGIVVVVIAVLIGLVFYLAGAYRQERKENHQYALKELANNVGGKVRGEVNQLLKDKK